MGYAMGYDLLGDSVTTGPIPPWERPCEQGLFSGGGRESNPPNGDRPFQPL